MSKPTLNPGLSQPPTTAIELVVVAYQALPAREQDELLSKLQALRLQRQAGEQSETERMLSSLQLVSQLVGRSPAELTSDDYRAAIRAEIKNGGPGIEPLSRVIKHFGSWRLAKEALTLAGEHSALQIEARFASRRLGRVHSYSEEVLRETLRRCAAELGHSPAVGEFKAWRQKELELARAQGRRDYYLPSLNAYRRHNTHWRDTLRVFLDRSEQ
jgi:hypothetical protein